MRKSIIFSFLLLATMQLGATHYRAGEIIYRNISYLQYGVTVIVYTTDINFPPDRDTLEISWGDGTTSMLLRINGPVGPSGVPQGELVGNNIKKNIYGYNINNPSAHGVHTYPGPRDFYIISIQDPNRVDRVKNMTNSIMVPFYVEDTLKVYDPNYIGSNSSPILLNPPIDYANVNVTFYHNPAAFDPDGDSLTFELVPPLRAQGIQVPGYRSPDEFSPGINNVISINRQTGELIWDSPKEKGIYNIAILIREFRGGILMGSLLRDMQIFVEAKPNNSPVIDRINDTCVVAGALLQFPVRAIDPDAGQIVTLTAYGGPFELNTSPAVFQGGAAPGQYIGQFRWQTVCDHIRKQFYQVVFKAEDNYTPPGQPSVPLSYLETWHIKVVAPAPQNLTATTQGNQIVLTWDNPYNCNQLATQKFIGFSVWKREGSNPFVVDTCQPGLAGRGYTRIARNLQQYSFTDNDVVKGKQYCYRVLAEFAEQTPLGLYYNQVESLPSNEACSELKRDVPLIINVDVTETDNINGKIFVRWVKPLANNINLDTTQFPGPYRFELKRSEGFTLANPVTIATFNSVSFGSYLDTLYTDSLINTRDNAYSYRVDFFSNGGNVLVGSSEIASSVFLNITGNDNRLDLSWQVSVPWQNDTFYVYRKDPGSGSFNLIGSTNQNNYADLNLTNDVTYCYYVKSSGRYSATTIAGLRLYNNSQQQCASPTDSVSPCPPQLIVQNDCNSLSSKETCIIDENSFQNRLKWNNPNNFCANDVIKYRIYHAFSDDTTYALLDEITGASDTTYTHFLSNSLAGCYYVTAIDSYYNESLPSNKACADNCPCYILPNVFTPNGDGHNDLYTPILPYRFIDKVEMKIYNRWGNLVFETTDPMINWNGKEQKTKKDLKEGVYFYSCKVYEIRVEGVRESGKILSGYIHLIRGNAN
jgi:gliding motility-associated-like protein